MTHSPRSHLSTLGRRLREPAITRLMAAALERPGVLSLAAGFTDNATLPTAAVSRALGALTASPQPPEWLQYGTNQGRPGLRRQLARRLSQLDAVEGRQLEPSRICVTNGSQQALHLAAQTLADPGDVILVEDPTYFVFLDALCGLGVRAVGLPAGLIEGEEEALDRFLAKAGAGGLGGPLRALYLMGYYGNPTACSVGEAAKRRLGRALSRRLPGLAVIEDAAYRELAYDGAAGAPSVLALPEFDACRRLYLGTLTKSFATGLKVGWAACDDAPWLAAMLYLKGHEDFGSSNFAQALLEQVMETGEYDGHLARIRAAYRIKMEALHGALIQRGLAHLGWSWEVPAGGLYLWLQAPASVDTGMEGPLFRACLEAGVLYVPGDLCFASGEPRRFVRLSFGVLEPTKLAEAARRFTEAARSLSVRTVPTTTSPPRA